MVRTSETSGNEDFVKLAAPSRHPVLLGSRIFRILRTGSRQQDRLHRKRRSIHLDAAKSSAGGDIADGIHYYRNPAVQRRGASMESHSSLPLPDSRRLLCLFKING